MVEDKETDKGIRRNVIQELQREPDVKYKTPPQQLQAVRKYRKKHSNPSLEGYMRIRRQAFTFVNPKEGTRAEDYIREKGSQYYKDLVELDRVLNDRIKELHLNIGEDK
ncbi:hypothetical protein LMB49_03710 [Limosilactobacillus reuteri]|uniref:hypothetical protein n=1 Tax=Limosilactobacillus reuteri TaxID=1598 RepID=UPI001E3C2C18|nr:hypothetical protein [Limosilactobacillus reuteri]MCC4370503.1 hypothetical protein [Limosilactobacillus reuteri]MCC4509442.1 hypothetical protein [Limosilactobacillus reuteri]